MTSKNPFWLLQYAGDNVDGNIHKMQIDPETARRAIAKFNEAFPRLARLVEERHRKQRESGMSDVQES